MELEQRAIYDGVLEIRAKGTSGSRTIYGTFPYNKLATLRNRGKVRKEMLMSHAFRWSVDQIERIKKEINNLLQSTITHVEKERILEALQQELQRRNIHILSGHSFDKVLGSALLGAAFFDDEENFSFEVPLPEESKMPTYMQDTVKQIEAGLLGGISPGFLPVPKEVKPDAETLEPEPGNPSVYVRKIKEAVLVEMSLVTRPAYSETSLNVRAEDFIQEDWDGFRKQVMIWL